MERDVTVTLDVGTARWLREEAARRNVSVSRFIGDVLEERRGRTEGHDAVRKDFLAREPRPLRRPGDGLPTRDEVHERRSS